MNRKQPQSRYPTKRKAAGPASASRKKQQDSDDSDEKSSSEESNAPPKRTSARAGPASRRGDIVNMSKKMSKDSSDSDGDSDGSDKKVKRPGPKSSRKPPPGPRSAPKADSDEHNFSDSDDPPPDPKKRPDPSSLFDSLTVAVKDIMGPESTNTNDKRLEAKSRSVTQKADRKSDDSSEEENDNDKPMTTTSAPGPRRALKSCGGTAPRVSTVDESGKEDDSSVKRSGPKSAFKSLGGRAGPKRSKKEDSDDEEVVPSEPPHAKLAAKEDASGKYSAGKRPGPKSATKLGESDNESSEDEEEKPAAKKPGPRSAQREVAKKPAGKSTSKSDDQSDDGNSNGDPPASSKSTQRGFAMSRSGPKSTKKSDDSSDDEESHKKVLTTKRPGPKGAAKKDENSDDEEKSHPKKAGSKSVPQSSKPGSKITFKAAESSDEEDEPVAKKPGPKSAPSSKPGQKIASKAAESSDGEEDEPVAKKPGPKSVSSSKSGSKIASKTAESSDDEEDEPVSKKPGPKSAASSKPGQKIASNAAESSGDEDDEPVSKKPGPKSVPSSKPGPKSASKVVKDSDDEEDEPVAKKPAPKSAPSSKPGPKSATKAAESLDDEEDEPVTKKPGPKSATPSSKPGPKSASKVVELSDDEEASPAVKKPGPKSATAGPKSARKPATSGNESSEEDAVKSTAKKILASSRSGPKSKKTDKVSSDDDEENGKTASAQRTKAADDSDGESTKGRKKGAGSRSQRDKEDLENMRIVCSSCGTQLNLNSAGKVFEHPALGVLCCKGCQDFYSSGNFTQDENGLDEYCRWCGEGGKLMCCDYCHCAFCEACIRRNLGRQYLSMAAKQDKWHCLVCDKKPLADLQDLCRRVLEHVNSKATGRSGRARATAARDVFQSASGISDPRKAMMVCLENVVKSTAVVRDGVNGIVKQLKAGDGSENNVIVAGRKLIRWIKLSSDNNAVLIDMARKQLLSLGVKDLSEPASDSETASRTSTGKKKRDRRADNDSDGTKKKLKEESTLSSSSRQTPRPCRSAVSPKKAKKSGELKQSPAPSKKWMSNDSQCDSTVPDITSGTKSKSSNHTEKESAIKKKVDESDESEDDAAAAANTVEAAMDDGGGDTDSDHDDDGGGGTGGGAGSASKNGANGDSGARDKGGDSDGAGDGNSDGAGDGNSDGDGDGNSDGVGDGNSDGDGKDAAEEPEDANMEIDDCNETSNNDVCDVNTDDGEPEDGNRKIDDESEKADDHVRDVDTGDGRSEDANMKIDDGNETSNNNVCDLNTNDSEPEDANMKIDDGNETANNNVSDLNTNDSEPEDANMKIDDGNETSNNNVSDLNTNDSEPEDANMKIGDGSEKANNDVSDIDTNDVDLATVSQLFTPLKRKKVNVDSPQMVGTPKSAVVRTSNPTVQSSPVSKHNRLPKTMLNLPDSPKRKEDIFDDDIFGDHGDNIGGRACSAIENGDAGESGFGFEDGDISVSEDGNTDAEAKDAAKETYDANEEVGNDFCKIANFSAIPNEQDSGIIGEIIKVAVHDPPLDLVVQESEEEGSTTNHLDHSSDTYKTSSPVVAAVGDQKGESGSDEVLYYDAVDELPVRSSVPSSPVVDSLSTTLVDGVDDETEMEEVGKDAEVERQGHSIQDCDSWNSKEFAQTAARELLKVTMTDAEIDDAGPTENSQASRAKRELLNMLASESSDDDEVAESSAAPTKEVVKLTKSSTPKPSRAGISCKLKIRPAPERSGLASVTAPSTTSKTKKDKSFLDMKIKPASDERPLTSSSETKKKKRLVVAQNSQLSVVKAVAGAKRGNRCMKVVLRRLRFKNLNHVLEHGVRLKPSKCKFVDDDSDSALDAELRRLADLRTLEKRRRVGGDNDESSAEEDLEEIMFEGKPKKAVAKPKETVATSESDTDSSGSSSDEDACDTVTKRPGIFEDDNVKSLNDRAKNLLKDMLNSSSDENSSSDSDSDDNSDDKASDSKKKKNASKKKPAGSTDSGNDDDDSDNGESGKKSRKRDRLLTDKIDSDSDSDFANFVKKTNDKKKIRKRGRIGSCDSEEASEDDDSDSSSKRTKRRTRGKVREAAAATNTKKRRRRIKEMSNSSDDSDVQFVKRKKRKKDGSEEDEDDPDSPSKKGRKNIRKLIKDSKLRTDTKIAAKEEEERRRRVEKLQKVYNEVVDESERGCLVTKKLVLAKCDETGDPLVEVHQDLIVKLKPHQVQGVKFLWESVCETVHRVNNDGGSGCILAHCMGLGKTLQVISFLHTILTSDKTNVITGLVVCPLNTVVNWYNECRMWLDEVDPSIEVNELSGVKTNPLRSKALNQWHEDGGIMIIGYEMFRNLVQEKQKKCTKYHKSIFLKALIDPGPDVVVCDEGHILKNSNTALSKAMARIKTRRRVVLTGTPLQNNLTEYHCMVDFVKPSLLGTMKEFQNRFSHPISNGQCADSTAHDVRIMKKRAHILHNLLDGCVQRRDYNVLTPFLPPKYEYVINVRLTPVQIQLYSHYMKHYAQKAGQGKSLFVDYQLLYRIWTHPWLLHMGEERQRIKDEQRDLEKDDESFIDDSDDSESEPGSDTGSNSGKEASTSKAKGGRKKKGRKDDSSGDEVVKNWKTRRQRGLQEEEIEEILPLEVKDKSWWAEYIAKEELEKIELSGKMIILLDLLKECEAIGDKILVFSQSLLTLNMIEGLLNAAPTEAEKKKQEGGTADDKDAAAVAEENSSESVHVGPHKFNWLPGLDYFRIDGSTSAEMRNRSTKSFNDPENYRARLFLISTRAGSLGINLVAANRVVMIDASWNPTHDVQSIFRVYRFGQEKPVYIYRLLAQGTMEEKIYDRQVTKQSLACRVVDEQQIERHFNLADLQELYSFDPESSSKHPTPIIPKDRLLAELLIRRSENIVGYHIHDSLLENKSEEELPEEERKVAWVEYETERAGLINSDGSSGYHVIPFTYCGTMNGSLRIDATMIIKTIIDKNPNFSLAEVGTLFRTTIEKMANERRSYMEKQEQERQKMLIQQREVFLQQQAAREQQQKLYLEQMSHLQALAAQGVSRPEDVQAQLQLQQLIQRHHFGASPGQMMGMRHVGPNKTSGYPTYRHPLLQPGMVPGSLLNNLDPAQRQMLAATGNLNNIAAANFQRQISNMMSNKGN